MGPNAYHHGRNYSEYLEIYLGTKRSLHFRPEWLYYTKYEPRCDRIDSINGTINGTAAPGTRHQVCHFEYACTVILLWQLFEVRLIRHDKPYPDTWYLSRG